MRLIQVIVLLLAVAAGICHAAERESFFLQDDLDKESLHQAIQRSLDFLVRLPADRVLVEQPRKISAQEIKNSLLSFAALLDLWDRPAEMSAAIRSQFDFFPSAEGVPDILLTGYYRPIVEASLTQTEVFRFPLYSKPKDLIEAETVTLLPQRRNEKSVGRLDRDQFVRYFSRDEIDRLGALRGKGNEIAWVKDPVDLFFLHIQGSGLLKLEGGRLIAVSYAASNGRPYTSIGKVLMDGGRISDTELSMQRLRRYLADHPDERDSLLAQNESYVFFRFVKAGPLGSLEVPLTPGRSIATDAQFYPKGALGFVVAQQPVLDAAGNLAGWSPFSRFVLNQDAGSAIRGPKRVDLYFGSGDGAGASAGFMRSTAQLFFLVGKKPNQ